MKNMVFMNADEVAKQLDVSRAFAYKIIKSMNCELQAKGFVTISGRVSRKFFEERVYGIKEMLGGETHGTY